MTTAASVASKGPLITGALASATVEGGPGAPPRLHKAKHYPTDDVIIARLDVDANVEAVRNKRMTSSIVLYSIHPKDHQLLGILGLERNACRN